MPNHHLDDTLLLEYATGALDQPVAVLTATHLALCPDCRCTNEMLEHTGGQLLADEEVVAVRPDTRAAVFAALDALPVENSAPAAPPLDVVVPRPLRDLVDGRLDAIEFRRVAPGLEAVDLLEEAPGYVTRLLRIAAGKAMPRHTHHGDELTLVLDGAFHDDSGVYRRGDVASADPTVDHRPVAEAGDDCICLTVTAAPVKLTGPFGRLLNPFVRF